MSCMSVTSAKKTSICLPVLCHCCNIYRRRKHCLARTQKLIDWNHIIIKAIFCYHLAHEISRKTLTTPLSSNYNIILLHVLLDFNAIFWYLITELWGRDINDVISTGFHHRRGDLCHQISQPNWSCQAVYIKILYPGIFWWLTIISWNHKRTWSFHVSTVGPTRWLEIMHNTNTD